MRHLITLAVTAVVLCSGPAAQAQTADTFPTRPLRLVVPLPAGGPSDFIARQVAQRMAIGLGQAVVVENKPGADGLIAAREVAAAAADGHTMLYAPGSMIAAPLMNKGASFDWTQELAPLGKVGRVPFALAVHPDVPVKTVAELVAHAGARPEALNVATSTPSELMAAAQFMKATGVRLTRVPYKGGTQAMPDLLAGRVQLMFGPIALLQPHAKTGALRVLALLAPARSAALPDVPTMAEAGQGGVGVPTWQAVYTGAKVPAAVQARLAREVAAAVASTDLRAEFERRTLAVEATTPADLAATIAREQAAWAALVAEYKLASE